MTEEEQPPSIDAGFDEKISAEMSIEQVTEIHANLANEKNSKRKKKERHHSLNDDENPGSILGKLLGNVFNSRNSDEKVREAIEELIEQRSKTGGVTQDEQLLLANVFHLREHRAVDVMVPRIDIVSFPHNGDVKELAKLMVQKGHSRIPVHRDSLDDIVGIATVKDVLNAVLENKKVALEEVINTDVKFVSPAMRVIDLLREMQMGHSQMVFVVDEYGGTDGLVTLEDLVEEIVGEMEDEFDNRNRPEFLIKDATTIEVDARLELEDLEELIGSFLTEEDREDEDIDTIGGLVSHLAGRIPAKGEIIKHSSGVKFKAIDTDPRKIKRLLVSDFAKKLEAS